MIYKSKTKYLFLLSFILFFSSCVNLTLKNSDYKSPPVRAPSIDTYYNQGRFSSKIQDQVIKIGKVYTIKRILIESGVGEIKIDLYKRKESSDTIVLVFPVLGGKHIIEEYFADYFARNGFDAAIVHRNNEFKNPDNVDNLEQLLRENIVRDRVALDVLTSNFGKKRFGSFGISRGAINVAMTAGVDERLKSNVLALGGTDLVNLFRYAKERRIRKYVQTVLETKGISNDQFFEMLHERIKTDPKYLAQYLDAKHTFLILAALDKTVPYKYGKKLRKQIGNPDTVILFANHYTSLLFTQIAGWFVPTLRHLGIIPYDFVESEAVNFYRREFNNENTWWRGLPHKILNAPINGLAWIGDRIF